MKKTFIRTGYNYDRNQVSQDTGLACKDKSLAQQQFAEESDINYIAERYGLTGEMPHVLQLPSYGDFTGIFDFQSAQNTVVEATRQFMTLPAKIRARFQNSPQQLLEFLNDPDNREEAEALKLIGKREAPLGATTTAAAASSPAPKGSPTPAADGTQPAASKQTDKPSKTDT